MRLVRNNYFSQNIMATCYLGNVGTLQTLHTHTGDVMTCDFAPDFTLITGSSDKTVRVWEWTAGSGYMEKTESPLRPHKYSVTCVRVSPQGAMFATASVDGTATLWSLRSLTKLHTMVQVNGDSIRICRFSPDSFMLLTGGDNGAICVWDLIHKSLIRNIFKHQDTVQSLAFTSDSQLLVSACSLGVLNLWSVSSLTDIQEHQPQTLLSVNGAHDLGVLSCDIKRLIETDDDDPLVKIYTLATCGNNHSIKIWSVTHRSVLKSSDTTEMTNVQMVLELEGHKSAVTCIQYSLNNYVLVSTSLDRKIKLWNKDGKCLTTLENHSRYINCVCFSRDTSLLSSGSNDRSIIIWDLTGTLSMDSVLSKPITQIENVLVNGIQESQVVQYAETDDNEVKLIKVVDDIADGSINCCRFYRNNTLGTASSDKLIKIFHLNNNVLEETYFSPFKGHTFPVNCIDFTQDGLQLASCSLDGSTIIWDTQTGEQLMSIPKNNLSIRICKYSHSSNFLITAGDDETAYVWNSQNMELITSLQGHSNSITSSCFTPDDAIIVTTSINGDFRLWTLAGNSLHVQDDAHDLGIQSCDFSQNLDPVPASCLIEHNTYLLATCGNDSLVKLWTVSVPKTDKSFTGENLMVKLWRTLLGHGGNVLVVNFAPNTGEIICSAGTDRQVRLWSVYSSDCLHVLEHDSITTSCSFGDNTNNLAIACLDKTLWLWKLPQKLIFQTIVANKIKNRRKLFNNWNVHDLSKWAKEMRMHEIADKIMETTIDGRKLLTLSENNISAMLKLDIENVKKLKQEIQWHINCELNSATTDFMNKSVPEEFLCPITHEIMRVPVTCGDGFTYEKQAITEWFLSGKFTSPMTNERLQNTDCVLNQELKSAIMKFCM